MSSENLEVVRSMFEAYGRRDLPAVLDTVHPDVELQPGLVGGLEGTVYRGLDGYRQFLDDVDATWTEFRIAVQELRDLGDTVVVLGHTWGRGREGIAVDAPGGWVLGMREGEDPPLPQLQHLGGDPGCRGAARLAAATSDSSAWIRTRETNVNRQLVRGRREFERAA